MKWVLAAFVLVPMVVTFLPGLPLHGYGQVWWALPLIYWFKSPGQRRRLALYVAGLLLQVLAYPEPDLGFLGWVLLWPYLLARGSDDGASWWRAAFLFGFLRAHVGFHWLGAVHYSAWLGVSLGSGLVFAFCFEGLLRWARVLPFAFRVGAAWAAFEAVHSWFLGGLPWLFLSHTQYRYPLLIQSADIAGAGWISFLMAFSQAAVFRRTADASLAVAGALLALSLGYGIWRSGPTGGTGPGVLMVQSRMPHSVKEQVLKSPQVILDGLRVLTRRGLRAHPETRLVVWPETMFPNFYIEDNPSDPGRFLWSARLLAAEFRRPAIYGLNSFTTLERFDGLRGHNSVALIDAEGTLAGIYRKQRLVPMGEEFLPRRVLPESWCDAMFPWLVRNVGYPASGDLEPGEGHVTLDAGQRLRCAVLVCFEGLYPQMARAALATGEPDLMLHLANHGWFGRSWEQRQSLASWVLRAVETRTPFLSCANGGITCAVGPDGRFLGKVDRVMEEGLLFVRVPPRWRKPPYLRGGPWILPGALLCAVAVFFLRGRRRP